MFLQSLNFIFPRNGVSLLTNIYELRGVEVFGSDRKTLSINLRKNHYLKTFIWRSTFRHHSVAFFRSKLPVDHISGTVLLVSSAQFLCASCASIWFQFYHALWHCMLPCSPRSHTPDFSKLCLHLCNWLVLGGFEN